MPAANGGEGRGLSRLIYDRPSQDIAFSRLVLLALSPRSIIIYVKRLLKVYATIFKPSIRYQSDTCQSAQEKMLRTDLEICSR